MFGISGSPTRAPWPLCLWSGQKATKTKGDPVQLSCQEVSSQVSGGLEKQTCITFSRSKRIDIVARIIFPIIFATFNLCYWAFYLSEEHKSLRQAASK